MNSMTKLRFSCFLLFFCLFCAAPLTAAEGAKMAVPEAVPAEGSGFDILKSSMDQALGALAPALEAFAKNKAALAEAAERLLKAKGWGLIGKFFGGGLDCINAFKNGWDVGTALNNCISALQKEDFSEFTKQFNSFAQSTVKTVVGIGTAALVATATTAGTPVLAIVGAGLAIGVATDYLVSKIDLKRPLNWVRNTWNSFGKGGVAPPAVITAPVPRSGGGQRSSSPPVKLKKHQVH